MPQHWAWLHTDLQPAQARTTILQGCQICCHWAADGTRHLRLVAAVPGNFQGFEGFRRSMANGIQWSNLVKPSFRVDFINFPSIFSEQINPAKLPSRLLVARLWSWHLTSAPRARFVEVKSERDTLARRWGLWREVHWILWDWLKIVL